ncbi:hypothetical protein HETIRDRAFT_454139 [Heterobasidion irregulare TC 32-1]|uniref:Serine protease n=1 Tax=Heterobasidion irregulare (strain TC 32-1) TaxID=747525 RepID=W4JYY5_HETIT|nr:uncharacterized protein HETIRDRAFT_454139 [Heterobasidion irregulare TC 32-1]ETW78096.1 hypothetical protein HETIRDRAFT_454139 [Heterobasidion irregulare TC 32-1]
MRLTNEFINKCIIIAERNAGSLPPSTPVVADIDLTKDVANPLHPPTGSNLYHATHSDYYGLPSNPISIYHIRDPWPRPTGPEAQRVPREARPICNHPIARMWRELGKQVYEYFDSVGLRWTSIDPVRFAEVGKGAGPLFLWVGVMPVTLSCKDAEHAAVHCQQILAESEITGVEIAFRESVFTRELQLQMHLACQLLKYVPSVDPTADVRSPFTPTLGLQIAPKSYPHFEGTGGLYLREGCGRNRVLLTARHVVLPPSEYRNELYACKTNSSPCRDDTLLGNKAYHSALESIMVQIECMALVVDYYKDELEGLGEAVGGEDATVTDGRDIHTNDLAKAEKSIEALSDFHGKITRFWSIENQRTLGHVLHAPPISALVKLHHEKIDWTEFKGNVIYLGIRMMPADFVMKMRPHVKTRTSFKYPRGGLLQLRGVVKEDELRHPTMLDANGEECLIVVKNGNTTGVTIGRVSSIESFVREYDDYNIHSTSMEVAIYSYSHDDGAFSAPGDSGSIIADANSRILGILTGGTGQTDSTDVTYASPYYWVEERIQKAFPDSYLYPTTA